MPAHGTEDDPAEYLRQYRAAGSAINAIRRIDYAAHRERINAQKRAAYAARRASTESEKSATIKMYNNPLREFALVAGSLAPAIFALSAAIFKNKIKCKNKGSRNLA